MIYERLSLGATQPVGLGHCPVGCNIGTKQSHHTWCYIPGVIMHGLENQKEVGFFSLTITSRSSFAKLFIASQFLVLLD